MFTPYPVVPGQSVRADQFNSLINALRQRTPIAGPGIRISESVHGFTVEALPAQPTAPRTPPAETNPAPWTVRNSSGTWEIFCPRARIADAPLPADLWPLPNGAPTGECGPASPGDTWRPVSDFIPAFAPKDGSHLVAVLDTSETDPQIRLAEVRSVPKPTAGKAYVQIGKFKSDKNGSLSFSQNHTGIITGSYALTPPHWLTAAGSFLAQWPADDTQPGESAKKITRWILSFPDAVPGLLPFDTPVTSENFVALCPAVRGDTARKLALASRLSAFPENTPTPFARIEARDIPTEIRVIDAQSASDTGSVNEVIAKIDILLADTPNAPAEVSNPILYTEVEPCNNRHVYENTAP